MLHSGTFPFRPPEPDVGMGEESQQEASRGARQEGGGQHHVAPGGQDGPQRHAARVHVDGAGRLLRHALHPAAAVHLHLRGGGWDVTYEL